MNVFCLGYHGSDSDNVLFYQRDQINSTPGRAPGFFVSCCAWITCAGNYIIRVPATPENGFKNRFRAFFVPAEGDQKQRTRRNMPIFDSDALCML